MPSLLPRPATDDLPPPLLSHLEQAERGVLLRALDDAGGNISRAAAALGLHRVTLHRKMERYAIRVSRTAH